MHISIFYPHMLLFLQPISKLLTMSSDFWPKYARDNAYAHTIGFRYGFKAYPFWEETTCKFSYHICRMIDNLIKNTVKLVIINMANFYVQIFVLCGMMY
jgi:hypothetical protein